MATSVLANWHGHDYQARYFWIEASRLKNPQQDFVIEVSYEADGPKAFDDVITRYNPPAAAPDPIGFRPITIKLSFTLHKPLASDSRT